VNFIKIKKKKKKRYGLGNVFYRQKLFDLAEYHFKKAIQINQNSPILYCYLSMVNLIC
jgi:tetratricopeptide (TPR) repeat protein